MLAPRFTLLSTLAAACLACQASASPLAVGSANTPSAPALILEDPLPPARSGVELRVGEAKSDSLEELVTSLGKSSGVSFTMTDQVRGILSQTRSGLTSNVEIPADQMWSWVEGLLVHHGFALTARSTEAPFLLGVVHPSSNRNMALRYMRVDSSQLQSFAAHQALLVRTTITLPHTDVRQLGNSLRALVTDPTGNSSILPAGATNSVVVSGVASQVIEMVALLEEFEAAAKAAHEARVKEQAARDAEQAAKAAAKEARMAADKQSRDGGK